MTLSVASLKRKLGKICEKLKRNWNSVKNRTETETEKRFSELESHCEAYLFVGSGDRDGSGVKEIVVGERDNPVDGHQRSTTGLSNITADRHRQRDGTGEHHSHHCQGLITC